MEQNKEKNSDWGGARAGSGRKRKADKAKYYGFYSTPETMAILEAVQGSKTDFINRCILAAAGK